mmetsp:Transcript_5503/g.22807  ORF Transcript_5503/g.22807 Transcript_5503/m.22807 type:complete len:280 (+) Transcript_5503:2132-2971(+)
MSAADGITSSAAAPPSDDEALSWHMVVIVPPRCDDDDDDEDAWSAASPRFCCARRNVLARRTDATTAALEADSHMRVRASGGQAVSKRASSMPLMYESVWSSGPKGTRRNEHTASHDPDACARSIATIDDSQSRGSPAPWNESWFRISDDDDVGDASSRWCCVRCEAGAAAPEEEERCVGCCSSVRAPPSSSAGRPPATTVTGLASRRSGCAASPSHLAASSSSTRWPLGNFAPSGLGGATMRGALSTCDDHRSPPTPSRHRYDRWCSLGGAAASLTPR